MTVGSRRASALRFGDPRVLALLAALVLFRLLPRGFTNRDLREQVDPLRGLAPEQLRPVSMTYDLRRLRLHGLIERVPRTRRHRVTDVGFRTALFLCRSYARLLRPGLATIDHDIPPRSEARGGLRQALRLAGKVPFYDGVARHQHPLDTTSNGQVQDSVAKERRP